MLSLINLSVHILKTEICMSMMYMYAACMKRVLKKQTACNWESYFTLCQVTEDKK